MAIRAIRASAASAGARSRTPPRQRSAPDTGAQQIVPFTSPPAPEKGKVRGRPRKADAAQRVAGRAASENHAAKANGAKYAAWLQNADKTPKMSLAVVGKTKPATSLFERAATALKPAGIVGRLPCRDEEQNRINAYLRAAVRQGGSEQVLYMAGMPGTGKTASFLESVRQLQEAQPFVFVHVNAMRLGTPSAVFVEIFNHLPGASRCSISAAHGEVYRFFSSRRKTDPVVVLLIDEIDHLVTNSQHVLYSVFDLLSVRSSRLIIAAISNTMDLPERMLPRVASRFEIIRVDFETYTRDQIHNILCERLRRHDAIDTFKADALKLCAARVAAGSGDLRKALQLCLRSLEICRNDVGGGGACVQVTGRHLDGAAKDLLYANPATSAIAGLSCKTRRVLLSVLLELRRKESDVVPLQKAVARYERLTNMCSPGGGPSWTAPSSGSHAEDASMIIERLETMHLLCLQNKAKGVHGMRNANLAIALGGNLDTEDLATALLSVEEDAGVRNLLKD